MGFYEQKIWKIAFTQTQNMEDGSVWNDAVMDTYKTFSSEPRPKFQALNIYMPTFLTSNTSQINVHLATKLLTSKWLLWKRCFCGSQIGNQYVLRPPHLPTTTSWKARVFLQIRIFCQNHTRLFVLRWCIVVGIAFL
jgi:hypothetical protein